MNDYILIESISSKTHLQSAHCKDKVYTIKFGDRICEMSNFIESWVATDIHSYDGKRNIALWLRSIFGDLAPDEIELFYHVFQAEHQVERIIYSYEEIPMIANDNEYCQMDLSIFSHPIIMTKEQEKDALNVIRNEPNRGTKFTILLNWFRQYREKYGYEAKYKRDQKDQDYQLAWGFCVYHGLSIEKLKKQTKQQTQKAHINNRLEKRQSCVFTLSAIVGGIVMIVIGQNIEDFFVQAVLTILGIGVALSPFENVILYINEILNKRK